MEHLKVTSSLIITQGLWHKTGLTWRHWGVCYLSKSGHHTHSANATWRPALESSLVWPGKRIPASQGLPDRNCEAFTVLGKAVLNPSYLGWLWNRGLGDLRLRTGERSKLDVHRAPRTGTVTQEFLLNEYHLVLLPPSSPPPFPMETAALYRMQ